MATDTEPTQADYMRAITAILPGKVATTPDEFNRIVAALDASGACNLLCTLRYVDYIPPVQAVSFRVIPLPKDAFYEPKVFPGLAPKGETVTFLFREASGTILRSERTDDNADQNVRQYVGHVRLRGMNGKDQTFSKAREVDLRPGAPEDKMMASDKQRNQARGAIGRICETKAQLRAIRSALGIKQAYSEDDARKPFVIPVLVPNPDMMNPAHEAFMLAHAMDSVDLIYGKSQRALPVHEPEPGERDPSAPRTITVDADTGEVIDALPDAEADPFADERTEAPARTKPEEECTCPCGCEAQVKPAARKALAALVKCVRCPECYPWHETFDHNRHKPDQNAGIPAFPHETFIQVLGRPAPKATR